MTQEDFERLTSPENIALLESHINNSPDKLAFKLRDPQLVAWIKNLQKCKKKLPNFYAARCFVTALGFQQCSSEFCASAKDFATQSDIIINNAQSTSHKSSNSPKPSIAIDLTCGLGVDSIAISKHYQRVITLEPDPIKASIARYNFDRLNINNIEVICCKAEDYDFSQHNAQGVSLIYADPSRETLDGQRVYSIEQSSPNIIELLPLLKSVSNRILIKLSPMYDVKEAFDVFDGSAVEVVSLDGECKEVIIKYGYEPQGTLMCTILRGVESIQKVCFERNNTQRISSQNPTMSVSAKLLLELPIASKELLEDGTKPSSKNTSNNNSSQDSIKSAPEQHYLLVPDVVFYKSRTEEALQHKYSNLKLMGAYFYADSLQGLENFPGTILNIENISEYNPKNLKKTFKKLGIKRANIHARSFISSAPEAAKSLGLQLGGTCELYLTTVENKALIFFVSLHS